MFKLAICMILPLCLVRGIAWERDYDAALEKAQAEGKPLFIAVNKKGTYASERLVDYYYLDGKIVALCGNTVNLFASDFVMKREEKICAFGAHIPCVFHDELLEKIEGLENQGAFIVPYHIFLGPDGKVLFSVPYKLTLGELEWCLAEAVRKVDPAFKWELSAGARAPARIVYGKVVAPAEAYVGKKKPKPLTRDETMEISNAVRNGTGGEVVDKYYESLLITDSRMALDTVQYWLNADAGYGKRILRDIGRTSPRTYWTVAASALSHPDAEVRNEAAVAIELIADPRSWKRLKKRWSDERDISVKGNLIRAIASVGRADKNAQALVLKTAERDRNGLLRINALIGLVHLENREKVERALQKGLAADEPGVRAVAAYAIAVRREQGLADALKTALSNETDGDCMKYLKAASSALEGGELELIKKVLTRYAKDSIPRIRDR